jgi:hypothetical protein
MKIIDRIKALSAPKSSSPVENKKNGAEID